MIKNFIILYLDDLSQETEDYMDLAALERVKAIVEERPNLKFSEMYIRGFVD
jgi:hypothetical protein